VCEAGVSAGALSPSVAFPRGPSDVYLYAGQVFASGDRCSLSTIVGSCVAVFLVDLERGVGGACHYLLPHHALGQVPSARFGDVAIGEVLSRVLELGGRRDNLCAKVFGGASLMLGRRGPAPSLGAKNVEVARRILDIEAIPVVGEDVGGVAGRKLVFEPTAGHVWVKRL
jgi:chemotaxis protein CheD